MCGRMITDDSLSDEVFEDEATGRYKINKNSNLNVEDEDFRTPSPSGYPGYKPPAEALRMYGIENGVQENDDWKSYKIEDDDNTKEFDENLTHKVRTITKNSFLFKNAKENNQLTQ